MTKARQGIEMAITNKMNKAIKQKCDTPLDSSRKTDYFSYFLHIKASLYIVMHLAMMYKCHLLYISFLGSNCSNFCRNLYNQSLKLPFIVDTKHY